MGWVSTPEFLNTKAVPAVRDRQVLAHMGSQAGVVDDFSFVVTWTSGMNLSVQFGDALVKAAHPTIATKGLYHVSNDAAMPVTVPAADPSNNRVDQLVLVVKDPSYDPTLVTSVPTLEIVQGTPTPGATLNNRSGAAATLPPNSLRLADILVPNGSATLSATAIRDRRTFSRGCFKQIISTAGENTNTSATPGFMSSFQARCEISGDNPVEFSLTAQSYTSSASLNTMLRAGVAYLSSVDGFTTNYVGGTQLNEGGLLMLQNGFRQAFSWSYITVPPANMIGSIMVAPWLALYDSASGATVSMGGISGWPLQMTVRELMYGNNVTYPTS